MRLTVPGEHRADVGDEAERVQDGQQVQEGRVGGVVEPRLDRNGVVCK